MNKKITTLVSALLTLSVAGCGGGGSSSDKVSVASAFENNTSSSETAAKGRFVGMQGLNYKSGDHSGALNEEGEYLYEPDQTIAFYVGDILLGETQAKAEITLSDLAQGNAETEANLKRFLLTIDYDLAPMNGILVTSSIHEAAQGKSLDFSQQSEKFNEEARALLDTDLASDLHLYAYDHAIEHILPKLDQQRQAAKTRLPRQFHYPKVSAQAKAAFDDIESEAAAVFDLMLKNTVTEGDSPLEFIFKATNTKLVLDGDDGSLLDLYVTYKQRLESIGPNQPYIEREDFAVKPATADQATDVHHFVVMSDFQMRDDESPLNVNPLKFLIPASYYPASPHIAYQVDDMIRTLRNYESTANKPIELAVFTGDFTDISQYNEVRLGIDVLDGGLVNPDSGIDDDPIPGEFDDGKPNDTYDPFIALGLPGQNGAADIPWYYVAGNHDGLMLGNFPITDSDLNLFGKKIRGGTRAFFDNIGTGSTNWIGYDPSILGFLQHLLTPESFHIPEDPDRRVVDPKQIAQEMFNSSSAPHGHGMQNVIDQRGSLDHKLHYTFESPNGLIKHIALDTNMPIGPEGWLDLYDLSWLESELQAAQDNGQLVIVSSHHKPRDIILNGALLVKTLNQYPNVIAHLVAHSHINNIRPRPGDDAEHSYWEIESGSMVNWPQQFRILDIQIDKQSGTGIIKSTMLNHQADSPLHVSQRGRFLAYLERYLEGSYFSDDALTEAEGEPEDRNAYLYFKVPDSVLSRL